MNCGVYSTILLVLTYQPTHRLQGWGGETSHHLTTTGHFEDWGYQKGMLGCYTVWLLF